MLLPINYDSAPRAEFAAGVEMMGDRLRVFLEANGFEVVVPRLSTTLAVWKECVDEVGGISHDHGKSLDEERYEKARSKLALRILDEYSADGVISAKILVRKGRYSGRDLRWDGVARRVPIDSGKTTSPILALRGSAGGTSLRTSVFDRNGTLFFERYAGLEPMDGWVIVGHESLETGAKTSFWTRLSSKTGSNSPFSRGSFGTLHPNDEPPPPFSMASDRIAPDGSTGCTRVHRARRSRGA